MYVSRLNICGTTTNSRRTNKTKMTNKAQYACLNEQ
jgi:hypothetical protein